MAVADQLAFDFIGLYRRNPDETIAAVRKLRADAIDTKLQVARGGYGEAQLKAFWRIAEEAPAILLIKAEDIGPLGGLSKAYFRAVVKERRYPKLHNFLAALSAVVTAADSRLALVDGPRADGDAEWVGNPASTDAARAEKIQADLFTVVEFLKGSNKFSDVEEIDQYWRFTLIKLLETIVAMLKAPLVEPTIVRRASEMLKKVSSSAASDARKGFIGKLAGSLAEMLMGLLKDS